MGSTVTRSSYEIALTHRCNGRCQDCFRFLDRLPWPDNSSELTEDDVLLGAWAVAEAEIGLNKVKISGGEPTLHAECVELCTLIKSTWKTDYHRLFTNGSNPQVRRRVPFRSFISPLADKGHHHPTMISPADFGLGPEFGVTRSCQNIACCGRAFDAFGFAPCALATGMGRIFDLDPYSSKPVMFGTVDLCKHCLFSQSWRVAWDLRALVMRGKTEYPSRSYRKGLERMQDRPVRYTRFRDKLKKKP